MLNKGTKFGEAGMKSFGDLLRKKLGTEGRTERQNERYIPPLFLKVGV